MDSKYRGMVSYVERDGWLSKMDGWLSKRDGWLS
jgi:hypothetical protein